MIVSIFWQWWCKQADAAFMRVNTLLVFACARAGTSDLALRLATKRTTSLPEDGEPEYRPITF